MLQILNRIDWQLEDGYVVPKMTPQLMHKIKKLDDSPYGPIRAVFDKITYGVPKRSIDINTLIQYATFLEIST